MHPLTPDYAAELLDRDTWVPSLLEQFDAIDTLIRALTRQPLCFGPASNGSTTCPAFHRCQHERPLSHTAARRRRVNA